MHTKIEAGAGLGGGGFGATTAFGLLGFMWHCPYEQKIHDLQHFKHAT
jgi:4-diphosphocytidyl-2C-methyl-D-erythritol kinase